MAKNKYLVAVSYQVEVEGDDQSDAIGSIRYINLFNETVRELSVKVICQFKKEIDANETQQKEG